MQGDYLRYIGSSRSDNWVKIVDHAYKSVEIGSDGNVPPGAYSWNVHPEEVAAKYDLCVRVFSGDRTNTSLPPFVNEAANIAYLEMPIRFVQHLKHGDIPASVKTLLFHARATLRSVERLSLNTSKG